jgi:hypothetical protein
MVIRNLHWILSHMVQAVMIFLKKVSGQLNQSYQSFACMNLHRGQGHKSEFKNKMWSALYSLLNPVEYITTN